MCIQPKHILKDSVRFGRPSMVANGHPSAIYSKVESVVPCGKCLECLKARQNDVAARSMSLCQKYGSMHLVTLTYEDKYLPLAARVVEWSDDCIDIDSGEINPSFTSPCLVFTPSYRKNGNLHNNEVSPEFHKAIIDEFRKREKSDLPIYVTHEQKTENGYLSVSYTPSLNRRDLRLWIKRFRVYYERNTGVKLNFAYIACGEYGPNTCRPHYHICVYGLTDFQVAFMVGLWKLGKEKNFKRVNAVNPDKTSGWEIASRYVAKYVAKGKFECVSAKNGDCQKSRLMISRKSIELSDGLVSHYRCYDVFGRYDPDTLILELSGKKLSESQQNTLFVEIGKRNKFEVNGKSFPLPSFIIKKVWYTYDTLTKSLRSFTLRSLYSLALLPQSLNRLAALQGEPISYEDTGNSFETASYFIQGEDFNLPLEEKIRERDFYRFYSKSLF